MSDRFAVLILTHGRAERVITYKTLRRGGYTGDIYLVVDNEDDQLAEYKRLYGNQVIVFDKLAISKTFDQADNFQDRRAVIYARNASYQIAQELGLDYFLQLDDDYTAFDHKFSSTFVYRERPVKNLDRLFQAMLTFYKSIPAATIALAQNGDFQGGRKSHTASVLLPKRKAINTFFCSTKRPLTFIGRINEDVNTYVTLGNRGVIFLTIFNAAIIQEQTQNNSGGMTDLYHAEGTYRKSFYSVMYSPSCVKVGETGYRHRRIHHHIMWAQAVPCILREEHRKAIT